MCGDVWSQTTAITTREGGVLEDGEFLLYIGPTCLQGLLKFGVIFCGAALGHFGATKEQEFATCICEVRVWWEASLFEGDFFVEQGDTFQILVIAAHVAAQEDDVFDDTSKAHIFAVVLVDFLLDGEVTGATLTFVGCCDAVWFDDDAVGAKVITCGRADEVDSSDTAPGFGLHLFELFGFGSFFKGEDQPHVAL